MSAAASACRSARARTLDLDLILYGDCVLRTDDLEIPHPRFREREFVLAPLCEVAPGMKDPVTGLTMGELLERFRGSENPRTPEPLKKRAVVGGLQPAGYCTS